MRAELASRGSRWPAPEFVPTVESTNAEVAAAARGGAAEGFVLVAGEQLGGRGRLDRSWVSPRDAGLTLSVLLRPVPPSSTWGWLPIVAGLALLNAVRALCDVEAALKWPNDLLLGPEHAKAAGILAESVDGAVVLGIGVNVSTTRDELPGGATSLLAEGVHVTREALLMELLVILETTYLAWAQANGDAQLSGLLAAYEDSCTTLGRDVTVHLPHGAPLSGVAESIEATGGLRVRGSDGSLTSVVAADVVHVRPRE